MAKNKPAEVDTEATEAAAPVKEPKPLPNPQVPAQYKGEKGNYLPGKDARHASDVAKRILDGEDESDALRELGSDKLREKALKQVENARSKFATAGTAGSVVIGDAKYDARKVRGSGEVRVDGDNGWEVYAADSEVAGTFESTADAEKSAAEAAKAGLAE